MKIGNFDLAKEILIIAEIGNNHEGNFDLAKQMVDFAAQAGAGAVKFQTFKAEELVSRSNEERFKKLKSFELTEDQFIELSEYAKEKDILFLSTPFDLRSVEFLKDIVPAFKIASGDNTFYPLIDAVAKTGKPILLSSGVADISQLRNTKDFIENVWKKNKIEQELAILHCVSSYPANDNQANLGAIVNIKDELKCIVGYSDHTLGIDASLIAAALGARIIEKHFTISKGYSDFRDHQLSADKDDMEELVKKVKKISVLMGEGKKIIQESEKNIEDQIRRSIVAKHDLDKGICITKDDLSWVRPAGGLEPGREDILIGKKLIVDVKAGEMLKKEMVS